ncbi:hypothetical protein [Nocardia sp. NPDC024068]|uniref:hypothetical protein n=1 Tax=Nocardia sp. NPDC024068 TaxID=3157197 RepID=UPI003409139A
MTTVAAASVITVVNVGVGADPAAEARPINPYVPCPQWQEMHPGWPCWGNFPEIEEPTLPSAPPVTPPAVPQSVPTTGAPPPATAPPPPAAALTPPPPTPPPDPCKAIIPVPGYVPPALPGNTPNAPCSSGSGPIPPNPRELIEPYINPACAGGVRVLSSEDVHDVVIEIIGPLEIENPNDPFVRRVIDRTNGLNKCDFGSKNQIKQQVWNEVRDEWYRLYRKRFQERDNRANCQGGKNRSKDCEGLVAVCYKQGEPVTPPLTQQRDKYIVGVNDYIRSQGYPAIRIPVDRALRSRASREAERERTSNPGKYPSDPIQFPNGAAAGHVPDTTWSGPLPGSPTPYRWEALDYKLNASIGGQAGAYPHGYRAIAFVPGEWAPTGGCIPAAAPYGLSAPPAYGA